MIEYRPFLVLNRATRSGESQFHIQLARVRWFVVRDLGIQSGLMDSDIISQSRLTRLKVTTYSAACVSCSGILTNADEKPKCIKVECVEQMDGVRDILY